MSIKTKEKLAFKLRKYPADDDSAVPITCAAEKQALYDMQAVTRYTMIKPSELDLKNKRKRIRPYSCHFSSYSFMVKDIVRLGSYARNELLQMSPSELNVVFRDKEKFPFLKNFFSTTSSQVLGQSRPLLEGIKSMVKGGHIIDLVYVKNDKPDQKEQLTTFRRLKFILSQLYHNLLELENLGEEYNQTAEQPKVTDANPGTAWETAWRSGRKRYFDDVVEQLNDKDKAEELKGRKTRLIALDKKKKSYMKLSVSGLTTCKKESDTNKALGICKICDKRNIPFNKLNDHSNNCKKIKDIQQDLLKVNQWLIAECQKAARLKDKLHAFNTPSAPERKIKINGAHSIRSSDKEGSLIQECMTPNPRKVTAIEINGKPFATEKKPINGIQNESEKESMGSLKTNAEGPNNSFKKFRKCNSNEPMDGDTKAKEKLLDDKRKIGNDKSTKKGENKRTSMSEDEQAKKPQSQLSSSDEESEKKDPTKKQRFSHFKQYKLPSGNYSNTPERKQSNRIESDNSIRSNTNLEVKDTQTPKIEDSHLQPVKATSVCEEDELQIIDKAEEPIEKVVVVKKGDTAKFLDDMFSDESDDESPKNSVIVDDYHPQPKQSRFASHKIEAAVKDEEKPVIQDKDRSSDEDKKEKESCEEEQLLQTSPTAKISGFASKNSQVIQPQEQPKPSETMEKKSKISSEDSCFGDRFDMYEDGDEEQEADDESDEPEPSPPSIFKPSSFNNSKARQAQPIEITKPDVEDFTPTKDVPAETTKPFDLTPALKEDPIVVIKSKETIKESKESEPEPTNLEKVEENERSQPALNLKLDGKSQLQDAPDALPDSPAFLSGLLDNSEDESNILGGTSKSEKSSQKQPEDNQSVEIAEVPILRPSVSVKVTLSSLREAVPEPKEEKTPGNISFFSLMKRKNEAAESDHGTLTQSAVFVGANTEGDNDKDPLKTEGLSDAALAETKAKKNKFRVLSKKIQFQTQVREEPQIKVKTEREENFQIDQQNQDLKLLKLAMDCLTQIGLYGEEIRKYPYGENIMIDAKMEDFLARVESNQQYLIEVKMPSIKILEMVKKRLSYIREIKKIETDDAKLLKEKKLSSMPVGEGSFRKPKFPTTPFDQKITFADMLSKKGEKKDGSEVESMDTKSVSNTPKMILKLPEVAPKGADNLGGQKKSMMQILKERNSTFTENTKKRKF